MISRRAYATTIGDYYSLQFGLEPKETIRKRIDFAESFGGPPISVVISPFLEGSGVHVGHSETIVVVEHDYFEVVSGNRAGNYGVFWIAVGRCKDWTVSDNVVFPFSVGGLTIAPGRRYKPGGTTVGRTFRGAFEPAVHSDYGIDINPAVQLSPHWDVIEAEVGRPETLSVVEQQSGFSTGEIDHRFRAVSGNAHAEYYVHYLAMGTRLGNRHITDPYGVSEYIVGSFLIRMGLYQKNIVVESYGLGIPAFATAPIVIVTPYWHEADRNVGYAETINAVGPHFFEVASGNGASNYYVSWIAIGPR